MTGDDAVAVLRTEAAAAPQDPQKQADLNFYGGIRDSVVGAAKGAWTTVTDPFGAVVTAADALVHPVDTAKNMVARDDWAAGRGDVALGKVTDSGLLALGTLGAGKIASTIGRGRVPHAEERGPAEEPRPPTTVPMSPTARADAARGVVLDGDGRPFGVEDSRGVFLVEESRINSMRQGFREKLGEPDGRYDTATGVVENWTISSDPRVNVTYRTHSRSGGATVDINGLADAPVTRFHIRGEGGP